MRRTLVTKSVNRVSALDYIQGPVEDSTITNAGNGDKTMNWTDERVEKLKKLWSEGLSASQIAAQLGGVSRNAVIGKVHRLCLPGRAKAGGSTATARAKRPAPTAAPRAPSFTAARMTATRTVTRTTGATVMKEEVEIDAIEDQGNSACRQQCRCSDVAPPGADAADRPHLQMADR